MNVLKSSSLHSFASYEVEKGIDLYKTMMISRESDIRENILFRQGRGQFHLPSAGHEAMASVSMFIEKNDWVYCYYRDKSLLLGMGVPLYEIALSFFAKKDSSSGGRQMASHFSYKPLNIVSCATPTALQCLPSVGTAWGIKKEGKKDVVVCCIGDASTRQGEFFESIAFAIQENLPVIFIVEDNGYGISTPTSNMTPLSLNMLNPERTHIINGRHPMQVQESMEEIFSAVRNGGGPAIAWIKLDRLMSHTSSDSQEKYRNQKELEEIKINDPLLLHRKYLNRLGVESEFLKEIDHSVSENVKEIYSQAEADEEPDPQKVKDHIFSRQIALKKIALVEEDARYVSMSEAINQTFHTILSENNKVVMFGQDIEDPKGGVFGLTKGLSSKFPNQVHNSPLAEATIAGLASGLSIKGFLPIFELQFIDFVGTAFNQIVNQIATLRWRTVGQYKCPLILYAPCGSYISNGGPWHSQTNESWFAHVPGLKVYMPSNACEASSLMYHAAHGDDPTLILLPKNQFQVKSLIKNDLCLFPEMAKVRSVGEHLTIVAWGNCVEIAMMAHEHFQSSGISLETIDLSSIVPCDWKTIIDSVKKTGRLLVIQEDNQSCSFGEKVISHVISTPDIWNSMYTYPRLISRDDVHIGFNSILESAVLPLLPNVITAIEEMLYKS